MLTISRALRNRLSDVRGGPAQQAERLLGVGRVVLAIATLTAFAVRPFGPADDVRTASAVLVGYAIYAVVLALGVWRRLHVDAAPLPWILHVLDVGWIAAITLATGGVASPFWLLATFVLLSAAYRWGLRETIATSVFIVALLLGEGVLASPPAPVETLANAHFLVRAMYIVVSGTLLGYLSDDQRHAREAASSVARIARQLEPEEGARHALDGALRELLAVFDAKTVLLVARDQSHGRLYRWHAASTDQEAAGSEEDLEPADEAAFLFPAPRGAWSVLRSRRRFEVRSWQPGDRHPREALVDFPERFLAAYPFQSLLAATVGDGDRATHRLLVFDGRAGARELRMLQAIAQQLGPAIAGIEQLARLRSRVGAAERARVARDLHDGVIQSLIGLEMTVDVWRREAAGNPSTASKLEHIQNGLRTEVLELRDLIHRMKTVSVDPKQVLEHLAALVERFQRDTGIAAHFVSEIDDIDLTPHVCDEIVRIVQEALVNVRKHSGARHVVVRVGAADGCWTFDVDDDGRGFEFGGRRSQAELDVERKGPVIIKERVRAIGGQLAVESDPGHGARIEVRLPQRTHG